MHLSKLVRGKRLAITMVATVLMLLAGKAQAAPIINYGDFNFPPEGVTFTNVTESSGTDAIPLFGPPHVVSGGLDFNPAGFVASATGGAADITDGQLDYGVQAAPGVGINALTFSEGGDLTLAGTGTASTQVIAGLIANIKITEVDGNPITPISFSSNASISENLLTNPGVVQPWSMSLTAPISAELTALNIPYAIGATHLEVTMNNQLIAFSETGSAAFIAKKDFSIGFAHDGTPVPEPASMSLLALGLLGVLGRRQRSST